MKVLLDTHAFLWYVLDDPNLTAGALGAAIEGADTQAFISPASYWEIAIKISIGKYALTVPYELFWTRAILDGGFEILPIEIAHAAVLSKLSFHHKDPFDGLLVAQAMAEKLPLVSADPILDAYPIHRLW